MKVVLRNPRREVEISGNRRVKEILRELDIIPETVLVIRGDDLVTADQVVSDADTIELRPVMSGGSAPWPSRPAPLPPKPGWRHSLP
jgi:sulfur carrier protein